MGLIPSMVVAIAVGRSGIDTLLVASQVVLSITLPFVTLPLIYFTSSKRIMSVRRPSSPEGVQLEMQTSPIVIQDHPRVEDVEDFQDMKDFSNGKIVTGIGIVIWIVILAANVYVIVTTAMGM
jgi:metal iron transporter